MKYLLTLSFLSFLTLLACSPKSQDIATQKSVPEEKPQIPHYDDIPPQEFKWITEDGGESAQEFSPKIDILFVIDNSDSMKSVQDNLKQNIGKFTNGIIQNRMIDYHIGVISAWDRSERAQKLKRDSYQVGDLRFIKDYSGKEYNKRFLDRSSSSLIASSIHIGVTPYNQGGPENEEFFSPLLSAMEKTGHGATNENFFRDEAQLVVIIVTDADELKDSSVTHEQMAQSLFDFKKGQTQKVSVYGVLVKASDPDSVKDWALKIHPQYNPQCFEGKKNNGTCSGFGPVKLEDFILATNTGAGTPEQIKSKFIMGITSKTFGSDLARIGSDITVKTLEKDIFLSQIPRYDEKLKKVMIRVRYGTTAELSVGRGQIITEGDHGWRFNPDNNSIHLSGHIQYQYFEGARFAVDLIPITLKK